jgi:PIN domain nuclease of toxin-antitoxin system
MKLLLDTHIVLSHLRNDLARDYPFADRLFQTVDNAFVVSVATIWEIAIKSRLKKLVCPVDVEDLELFLEEAGFEVMPVTASHATAMIVPDVPTRDPFDRLLIAIAQIEDLQLVTIDRALAEHPVTFRGERISR